MWNTIEILLGGSTCKTSSPTTKIIVDKKENPDSAPYVQKVMLHRIRGRTYSFPSC